VYYLLKNIDNILLILTIQTRAMIAINVSLELHTHNYIAGHYVISVIGNNFDLNNLINMSGIYHRTTLLSYLRDGQNIYNELIISGG
jgi:hypothetical protein